MVLVARIWGFCHLEYTLIPPPPQTAQSVDTGGGLMQFVRRQAFS